MDSLSDTWVITAIYTPLPSQGKKEKKMQIVASNLNCIKKSTKIIYT